MSAQFLTKEDLDGTKKKPTVIFDSGYLQVLDVDGYHAVQEHDMVVCIPYFKESNTILLRYEEIPTYNMIKPEMDKFVTIMSETIKDGEQIEDCLRRGLKEEFGIVLESNYVPEILAPIFMCKGNTARYHICILPLMSYEYDQQMPEGDGTEHEKTANNVSVNINDLKNVMIYDLITRYALDIFKQEYSLF